MKANYAASGGVIRVRWVDGIFVVQSGERTPPNVVDRIDFDNRMLAEMGKMIAEGAELPSDPAARNAFVNALRKREGLRLIKQASLIACQRRLIDAKRAVLVPMGPPSKSHVYIRPADVAYAREKVAKEDTA